jgi:hypothetical protein
MVAPNAWTSLYAGDLCATTEEKEDRYQSRYIVDNGKSEVQPLQAE